jgi:hypothetical protein
MDVTGQPIELRDDQCGLGLLGSRDGNRKLRPVGTLAALDFAELGLKRQGPIRNSRGDSGVMDYAVVRHAACGIGERCRVQPALGDMPPAIQTAAPQEARRS